MADVDFQDVEYQIDRETDLSEIAVPGVAEKHRLVEPLQLLPGTYIIRVPLDLTPGAPVTAKLIESNRIGIEPAQGFE
jgi:hypothetical protein